MAAAAARAGRYDAAGKLWSGVAKSQTNTRAAGLIATGDRQYAERLERAALEKAAQPLWQANAGTNRPESYQTAAQRDATPAWLQGKPRPAPASPSLPTSDDPQNPGAAQHSAPITPATADEFAHSAALLAAIASGATIYDALRQAGAVTQVSRGPSAFTDAVRSAQVRYTGSDATPTGKSADRDAGTFADLLTGLRRQGSPR
jgi:hypothetical protein